MSSFRSCVQLYRWLINRTFQETLNRFSGQFDLSNPTPEGLLQAMDALETERRIFLARLAAFHRRRVREKFYGKRSPAVADLQALYHPGFFVTPLNAD